jgi:hypothetical protein
MSPPDCRGFAKAILDGWPEPFGDNLDGFELQELAFKHGILVAKQRTIPCSENCNCSEYCDQGEVVTCYTLAPELSL